MTDAATIEVTRRLAEFAAGLSYADLPEEVRNRARLFVLDGVSVMLGAVAFAKRDDDRCLERYLEAAAEPGPATVAGMGRKTTPMMAAFANGTLSEVLDCQDLKSRFQGSQRRRHDSDGPCHGRGAGVRRPGPVGRGRRRLRGGGPSGHCDPADALVCGISDHGHLQHLWCCRHCGSAQGLRRRGHDGGARHLRIYHPGQQRRQRLQGPQHQADTRRPSRHVGHFGGLPGRGRLPRRTSRGRATPLSRIASHPGLRRPRPRGGGSGGSAKSGTPWKWDSSPTRWAISTSGRSRSACS